MVRLSVSSVSINDAQLTNTMQWLGLQMYTVIFDVAELAKPDYFEEYVTERDHVSWLAGSLFTLSSPSRRSEEALRAGEANTASDTLRRFFDQRFAMTDDSCALPQSFSSEKLPDDLLWYCRMLYQHALLSMARMHYSQGELHASRLVRDFIFPLPLCALIW